MKRILLICFVLMSSLISEAMAQRTVSGKVSDDTGEGIPGVNVVIRGTSQGVITDFNGEYRLEVPNNDAVIRFTAIGYVRQEVPAGNRSTLDVTLVEDVKQLEEVVVTGYGNTTFKRDLTGAISSVKGDVIENMPVQSLDRAMQGRIAGVQVQSASGQPGGAINVRVRGVGSLSGIAANQPLYIVDGVQMSTTNLTGQASASPLASINPNDIESIEVLKDAAASAIYGAQSANGVVIVTTKRGKGGKTKISATVQEGIVQPMNLYNMMNSRQFAEIKSEAFANNPSSGGREAAQGIWGDPNDENLTNHDWVNTMFRNARQRNYTVTAQGGDARTTFYISGAYDKQEGQILASDYSRGSGRFNLTHKATDRLRLNTNITLAVQEFNGAIANGNFINSPFIGAFSSWPNIPAYQEDGSYTRYPSTHLFGYNILQGVHQETRNSVVASTVANLSLTYDILPGLSWTSFAGLNFDDARDLNNRPRSIPAFAPTGGSTSQTDRRVVNFNTNHNFNYYKKIGDLHTISGVLGVEYKSETEDIISATGLGFAYPELYTLQNAATPQAVGGYFTEYKRAGAFVNAKYDFDDRYAIDATFRRDGSSRFGSDNRWGNFYALAGTWRLSSEAFMENVDVVNDLKLRASYGVLGNSNGISNFEARGLYGSGGQYLGNPGVRPTQLENNILGWERAENVNFGLDVAVFNNRLTGTFDVWRSNTSDQLLSTALPIDSGFPSITENAANVRNEGIDIALTSVNVDNGGFQWRTNFNVSFMNNYLTETNTGEDEMTTPGGSTLRVGEPIYLTWGVPFAGVNPANGRAMFYDADGNITYEPTEDDRDIIGRGISRFYGGFGNTLSYKGFSLDVFFQYDYGSQVFNGDLYNLAYSGSGNDNQLVSQMEYWREPGQMTNVPRPVQGGFDRGVSQRFPNYAPSRFISDGSYIRLKQVTLSYDLPASVLQNIRMERVKVFVQGVNLLTWTNFTGIDPEVIAQTTSSYGTYPNGRVLTAGLTVGF